MQLSPLSLNLSRSYNFRCNMCENSSNPIKEENKSKQNNEDKVRISTDTYLSMMVAGTFNNLEEKGVFTTDENGTLEIGEDFEMDLESDNQGDFSANMLLVSLNSAAKMMGLPSEEEKAQIPTFVKMDYKNYISAIQKQIDDTKDALENMELPQISDEEYQEYLQMALEEGIDLDLETIMSHGISHLPEITQTQQDMLDSLKTEHLSELKETIGTFADAINYRFFRAINCGFEGNARGVIKEMTNGIEMHIEPTIKDNGDGTSTYSYNEFLSTLEVIKDNNTGDYIYANLKNLEGKGFELKFCEDGSIGLLTYDNDVDGSKVVIAQDTKTRKVYVQQVFDGFKTIRHFIQKEDGKLRQTSSRIFLNN